MDGVATTVTTAIGFLPSKGSNGKGGGIGGTVTVTVAALVVTAPDAAESWGVNHLLTL